MAMPMGETVRAKAEEIRTKVRTRIEEIRGGGSSSSGHSPLLGKLELAKGPLVTEIREKGIMATAKARIEKIRGGGGLLGSSTSIGEKVAVEKDTGALKFQRRKIAIEA